MVCITNCLIGAALVGGTIATAVQSKRDPVFQEFRQTLNPSQIVAMDKIADSRLSLYIQGTVLGLILVVLLALFGGKSMSPLVGGCTFVVIVLLTQYFYYILIPKQDWMLRHLTTREQNEGWLQVYRHMSFRWHAGMFIGLVGFFFLGWGWGNQGGSPGVRRGEPRRL